MDKEPNKTGKKKSYCTVSDLQAELDALRKKVEELKSIDEIIAYLDGRLADLNSR